MEADEREISESVAIIHAALRKRNMLVNDLAQAIGESNPSKVSLAINCSTKNLPRVLDLRRRLAAELGLEAEQVWAPQYLQPMQRAGFRRYKRVKPADQVDSAEWAAMKSAERYRSLVQKLGLNLREVAADLGVTYRVFSLAMTGEGRKDELREAMAALVHHPKEDIWPTLYSAGQRSFTPLEQLVGNKALAAFYGFASVAHLAQISEIGRT